MEVVVKNNCSGGRARSCGGWMQRKRRGGARSCGSGGEEVAVAAVKELRQWRCKELGQRPWRSCGRCGERCADSGGARFCGSCGGTRSFTVFLFHKKVDLKRKERKIRKKKKKDMKLMILCYSSSPFVWYIDKIKDD